MLSRAGAGRSGDDLSETRAGETLSSFILDAATTKAEVRRAQQQFIATGRARSLEVRRTGKTVGGEVVFKRLEQILERTKRRAAAK